MENSRAKGALLGPHEIVGPRTLVTLIDEGGAVHPVGVANRPWMVRADDAGKVRAIVPAMFKQVKRHRQVAGEECYGHGHGKRAGETEVPQKDKGADA